MNNKRLTNKFGDKVILPMIPMQIESKEDLENYHKVRKEYEDNTIRLSSYEDIGSIEEIINLKGNNRLLENGSKQLCDEIKALVKEKEVLVNALRFIKGRYEIDLTEKEITMLLEGDKGIYNTVIKTLKEIDI